MTNPVKKLSTGEYLYVLELRFHEWVERSYFAGPQVDDWDAYVHTLASRAIIDLEDTTPFPDVIEWEAVYVKVEAMLYERGYVPLAFTEAVFARAIVGVHDALSDTKINLPDDVQKRLDERNHDHKEREWQRAMRHTVRRG